MKNLLAQFAIFLFICTIALQVMGGATTVYAQEKEPAAPAKLNVGKYLVAKDLGQQKPVSIGQYIVRLINLLSLVIGSFSFTAIVIGGVILVISAGSEGTLQKGKDIIKYAIIGLVIGLAAYYITSFVQSIFYEYEA